MNHNNIRAVHLLLSARRISNASSRDAIEKEADRVSEEAMFDPTSGELWDRTLFDVSKCDTETREAYAAEMLISSEHQLQDSMSDVTLYLSGLLAFDWPNRFVSSTLFQNMISEGVQAMRTHHEVFNEKFLAGPDRAGQLSYWRDFFIKWLGKVPPNVLPND